MKEDDTEGKRVANPAGRYGRIGYFGGLKKNKMIINEIKSFIDENRGKPPSLKVLARKYNLTDKKLTRMFFGFFGISLSKYIASQKMEYALELLEQDKHSVSEVAAIIGVKGRGNFVTAFRKKNGVTPDIAKNKIIITEIKKIIDENRGKPYSLKEVTQKFNLTDEKLKKMFVVFFGVSLSKYIASQKMDYAFELLKQNKHSVSEVTAIIGVKGRANFAAAFRKKFGVTPSTLKSNAEEKATGKGE